MKHEPQPIGDIIMRIAADKSEPWSRILRQCPFIQEELLRQGKMTEDEVSEYRRERAAGEKNIDGLLDGQDVMMRLHISPRTLQTLRSNGTLPYTKIGRKIYYFRQDIERILKNNYVMYKIQERHGEDD